MSSKRIFFVMIAALFVLAAGSVGVTYFVREYLHKQSVKLVNLKLENKVLDQQQIQLSNAKKDLAQYASLETIAKSIVPQDKDQALTVREIVNLATANGIELTTITFPTSSLGGTGTGSASGGVGAAGGAGATGVTPGASNTLTQVKPVTGIPGVYDMQITIDSASTSYDQFISFLKELEANRRTAAVSNIVLQPDTNDRSQIIFNLTLEVYIKP